MRLIRSRSKTQATMAHTTISRIGNLTQNTIVVINQIHRRIEIRITLKLNHINQPDKEV